VAERDKKIRLVHIITDLDTGGAELMLYRLLQRMDRERFECKVISLSNSGVVGEKIKTLGIAVEGLGMQAQAPNPLLVIKLMAWLNRERPDLVQTWLYHADLLGGLAAWVNFIPVVWGIRNGTLPGDKNPRTALIVKVCARLSQFIPRKIISCSQRAEDIHVALGYNQSRFKIIPNGFDLSRFHPDPQARLRFRQELGIGEKALLVGHVARFDLQKDHQTLIKAAELLKDRRPDVHFVLCGDGVTWQNDTLVNWIESAGLRSYFHLLGRREDIPEIMAGLDLLVSSSSYGEAFPNVLGEAMSCGIACVATDMGDSAYIVGETGYITPPGEPALLANQMAALLSLPKLQREQMGILARQRVMDYFNLPDIVRQYEIFYSEMIKRA
jgi:glycosyltransferase involved in cell wall biosynthesis